jgi:hypothetical protein
MRPVQTGFRLYGATLGACDKNETMNLRHAKEK